MAWMLYFTETILKQLAVYALLAALTAGFIQPALGAPPRRGVITAAWLNVRSAPDRHADRVTALKRGTSVEVLEDLGK